ncbi:MAG: type II toxin-antitoxin system PemK/MazF family toxin [Candidatus Binatia bacterium]
MTPGSIALVRFPFSDMETTKKRPALVLGGSARSPRNRLVTVAMITSQIEALRIEGDVELSKWREAGLLHPSLLRLSKVATIDAGLVDKVIGELSAADNKAARQAFQTVFAYWMR